MVGAIQAMAATGLGVYPLWWALNLGTSIGGMGSPIAAACNVIIFGQVDKEKWRLEFGRYLLLAFPLVLIDSILTFVMLWARYLL